LFFVFFGSQSGDDHLAKSGYNPSVCVCVCVFSFFLSFLFKNFIGEQHPKRDLALNGDRFLEPVKLLVKKSATQLKVESKCGGKKKFN
jgi:hypothetical protein